MARLGTMVSGRLSSVLCLYVGQKVIGLADIGVAVGVQEAQKGRGAFMGTSSIHFLIMILLQQHTYRDIPSRRGVIALMAPPCYAPGADRFDLVRMKLILL